MLKLAKIGMILNPCRMPSSHLSLLLSTWVQHEKTPARMCEHVDKSQCTLQEADVLLEELGGANSPNSKHSVGRPEHSARTAEEQSRQGGSAARRLSARSGAPGAHSHGRRRAGNFGGARVRTHGRKVKQVWDLVHAYEQRSWCSNW